MSATMYGSTSGTALAGQAIFTDDVSLQVFMEHLKRLVSYLRCCLSLHITHKFFFLVQCRLLAHRRTESPCLLAEISFYHRSRCCYVAKMNDGITN